MPDLEAYRQKRDFTKTAEPRPEPVEGRRPEPAEGPPPGAPDAEAKNLVFVVQQHAAYRAGMHWDFRLEVDGVLKSWPLRRVPSLDPKLKRGATMVEDHPYDYRTFEGVIPKGEYGGGQVIVWDEGIYTPDEGGASWNDKEEGSRRMMEGISKGKISFTLQGHKLRGSFALVKTGYGPQSWLLIKHRDEFVSERDLIEDDTSPRSGLTITDLREGRLPLPSTAASGASASPATTMPTGAKLASFPDSRKERPMLATLVDKAFDRPGWLWEPKLDGIRALVYLKGGEVEIRSRRGIDVTRAYPALAKSLKDQPARTLVLDGEICALDPDGVPRFQLLQPRINLTRAQDVAKAEAEQPVVFFVFDLLYLDGYDLRAVPLRERKTLLQSKLATNGRISLVTHVEEDGVSLEEGAQALGFEGVVGKRAESRYEPGARSPSWLKAKTTTEQEFVVGGYTQGEGAREKTFGALAIGYYDDEGKLRWAGNAGSGFNDKELVRVFKLLKELEVPKSPFVNKVEVAKSAFTHRAGGPVAYVEPRLVAQVKYLQWTNDGHLRAPVYIGLRDDIDPKQVRRERPADAEAVAEEAAAAGRDTTASPPILREPQDERPSAPSLQTSSSFESLRTSGTEPSSVSREVEDALRQLENPRANFVVEVEGQAIKLTNLDKQFWPSHGDRAPLTKRDLVRYYTRMAPVLLPHLHDRPLTLTRYPNGVDAALFYQKHYAQPIPDFVDTVEIWSSSNNEDGRYILCNNLATLVWLAQIADLELHAWMSRVDPAPDAPDAGLVFDGSESSLDDSVLNYPDFMIFDLDPYIYAGHENKGAEPEFNQRGWDKTVEIALALKEVLDQMRLSSYVKTSGKTGLHVYVPILRHFDYDAVRDFTANIGRFLMGRHPKDITMEWDTSKRTGKVFFDHGQNTRGKTLAAQYSLRPTAWAGVSTPVLWSELPKLEPSSLNLTTVPARIAERGDLWADILQRKNDLAALIG